MKNYARKTGFTLVEILIVVIILGILAAIVIPQFTDASTSAKESSLESNLQALRSQCELYKVQHNDNYPWQDADGETEDDLDVVNERLMGITNADHEEDEDDSVFGPYMQGVPTNPFVTNDDAVFAVAAADDVDWAIDETTGAISDGREEEEEED